MLVMHGDRFVEGAQTREKLFLGQKAEFPTGPFYLAARFGVPVMFLFAVKSNTFQYDFFAFEPIRVSRKRDTEEIGKTIDELMDRYLEKCEMMIKRYPDQWFNFYQFWK